MIDGAATRVGREVPLPEAMQGRWVVADEPQSELMIAGGEISCFGAVVDYDFKEIASVEGALTVSLGAAEPVSEDSFRRANITDLVITPEGEFLAHNAKFGCRFVRAPVGSVG